MPNTLQRCRGALLGLACGDAVGTTLEFKAPGSFTPITDMVGGGPFHLQAGQWTDDTSMALCLAESLIERQDFEPSDQMQRYLRWFRYGHLSCTRRCFDIGHTVRTALLHFVDTGNAYSGSEDPHTAGNGSIMRLAPVVLAYFRDPVQAVALCADSSRTTHAAREAVDACRYFGALLIGALRGESKEVLLSPRYTPSSGMWETQSLAPKIDAIAAGGFKHKQAPQIKGTGYVVDSLEAALWVFQHTDSFRQGCLAAANLGDDADTTCAVYGQLAGAYYGVSEIPAAWLDKLAMRDVLDDYARRLYELSHRLARE